MLNRIEVIDLQAHKKDTHPHHNAHYRTSGGGGRPPTAQMTIDQPDQLDESFIRFFHVHSGWAPNGIKILMAKIDTGEVSTYEVTYQIRATTTDGSPTTIVTLTTSASLEVETSILTNDVVAAGSYVYAVLPATDINQLGLEINFEII